MKLRSIIVSMVCQVIFLLVTLNGYTQCGNELPKKLKLVQEKLLKLHLLDKSFTTEQSRAGLDIFFKEVDPDRMIFLKSEVEQIKQLAGPLTDIMEICRFYEKLKSTYLASSERSRKFIDQHTAEPFNYLINESYHQQVKGYPNFCASEKELSERWRKELKILTAYRMIYSLEDFKGIDPISLNDSVELEKKSRNYVAKAMLCNVDYIGTGDQETDRLLSEILLDCYVKSWDPHSDYFNIEQHDMFEQRLSESFLSYGILLSENDNFSILIERLIPGGAAWKTNRISEGDVVMAMFIDGKNLVNDPCITADEVMSAISLQKEQKMILRVRKQNGTLNEIELWNEAIGSEENLIRSFILKGDVNVGYIALPSFYTDFSSNNEPGCANDVTKELLYLKRDGIKGLILDLRNNGGGSVGEALALAGIFIDEGPFCSISDKENDPYFMKDPNRGIIYDGPMLVLINELSASASELTAGILQNYHRAIIAGSMSYGKATMQIIVPIDANLDEEPVDMVSYENGFIKVTTSVIYNLKNTSHQAIGIQPDISFPDLYRNFIVDEAGQDYVIKAEPIVKEISFSARKEIPLKMLSDKSAIRQNNSTVFKDTIPLMIAALTDLYSETDVPINFNKLIRDVQVSENLGKQLSELIHHGSGNYTADNHRMEKSILQFDEVGNKLNSSALERINGDVYLQESYNVMKDYIQMQPD